MSFDQNNVILVYSYLIFQARESYDPNTFKARTKKIQFLNLNSFKLSSF